MRTAVLNWSFNFYFSSDFVSSSIFIMAKNTASTAFRKIDVDQYNEDNFKVDDTTDSLTPSIFPDETEINLLLTQYPSFSFIYLVFLNYFFIDSKRILQIITFQNCKKIETSWVMEEPIFHQIVFYSKLPMIIWQLVNHRYSMLNYVLIFR